MPTAKKTASTTVKGPPKKRGNPAMVKGQSFNPSGRPKGIPNKATTQFKQAVSLMLDNNAPKFNRWLNAIAEGNAKKRIRPDPKGALDIAHKLAEYCYPKLARTEMTGLNGKELFEKMSDADIESRITTLMHGSGKAPADED